MTLKECYVQMGADYEGVMRRLGKEERVSRFLTRLLDEPSFGELKEGMESGDAETAFRASHSLKGICMNLGLTSLGDSASALTEELRAGSVTEESLQLYEKVKNDYGFTIECVKELG